MKLVNIKFVAILLIIFLILDCAGSIYIGVWREGFWSAIEHKELHNFLFMIAEFTVVAILLCIESGLSQYYLNYMSLEYRRRLTRKALALNVRNIEGIGQRIQEDCLMYPKLTCQLIYGMINNVMILVGFVWIIYVSLGFLYFLLPISYALVGTFVTHKLAKPLINLNYLNQVAEAAFRHTLQRLKYSIVHRNNQSLYSATKRVNYFQSFYSQVTVIMPYIILAPLYFTGAIVFGVLMQCSSAIKTVIECLSYFITVYPDINKWLSCRRRLKEINLI